MGYALAFLSSDTPEVLNISMSFSHYRISLLRMVELITVNHQRRRESRYLRDSFDNARKLYFEAQI